MRPIHLKTLGMDRSHWRECARARHSRPTKHVCTVWAISSSLPSRAGLQTANHEPYLASVGANISPLEPALKPLRTLYYTSPASQVIVDPGRKTLFSRPWRAGDANGPPFRSRAARFWGLPKSCRSKGTRATMLSIIAVVHGYDVSLALLHVV